MTTWPRTRRRSSRLISVLLTTSLLLALPGCGESPAAQFLTDLTWSIVKDVAKALPFADTTLLIVEHLQKAMSEDGSTGGRVGVLGFFQDPSLAAAAGIGVAGKFLPDYLAQQLQARGVDVSLLNAANIVGADGKPAVSVGPDGRLVLNVDPAQLGGFDYLLSGVVGRQDGQLVMAVKLVQPEAGGKVVEVVQAAQYDADTLSLLGVNKLMGTPPAPYVSCKVDSGERLAAKQKGSAGGGCEIVAQLGAGNLLCMHCPSVAPASYTDADGRDWTERAVEAFAACLQLKSYSTDSGPTTGQYTAVPTGLAGGTINLGGRSMTVLQADDGRTMLRGNHGDEYTITVSSTGFYHTGTRVRRRLAAYLAVDGVNTIGQELSLPSMGKKWVVESGKATDIPGWQLEGGRARRFKFVSFEDSVAVRLGAQENVGQITAVLWAEKDRGCPSGPLCQPEGGGVCAPRDITPSCICTASRGERVRCEEAAGHGGCVDFILPCKCRDGVKGPLRSCDEVAACYTASGKKVAMVSSAHTLGEFARGGGSGLKSAGGGGGSASGSGGKVSSRGSGASPMAADLGTGEGEEIDRAVETIALELEEAPLGVITVHYQGGWPEAAPTGPSPAQITN